MAAQGPTRLTPALELARNALQLSSELLGPDHRLSKKIMTQTAEIEAQLLQRQQHQQQHGHELQAGEPEAATVQAAGGVSHVEAPGVHSGLSSTAVSEPGRSGKDGDTVSRQQPDPTLETPAAPLGPDETSLTASRRGRPSTEAASASPAAAADEHVRPVVIKDGMLASSPTCLVAPTASGAEPAAKGDVKTGREMTSDAERTAGESGSYTSKAALCCVPCMSYSLPRCQRSASMARGNRVVPLAD